ncbi:unnamed protein product [Linum tenue]|uniref:Major facilitator superfamily (MFS) profile domain-containing protein n=2 Tax=Linum tenue TaxID=586396 RepID=A0AAV0K690_9ROSI|nr:unnamed protein product [Linum tenue]
MARDEEATGGRKPPSYGGEVNAFIVTTCIVAAFGGLIFGYDLGISGGVTSMDSFLMKFFPSVYRKEVADQNQNMYCKFDSHLLTLFTSSLYLSALVACMCASTITRKYGRKLSMLSGGLVFLAGAIINAAAVNVAMLIVGRLLLGVGVGFCNQSIPVYLSEIAPAKWRGAMNIGFQMMITIGILAANLVNYWTAKIESGNGWRISLGLAAVPALMITVGSLFLPDTPNSILERGDAAKAKQMLQKIRGTDDVDAEFEDLVRASAAAKKIDRPMRRLLTERTLGLGQSASLMSSLITGFFNVVATFVSIYVADRFGRRSLFLEGGIQMIICQVVVGGMIAGSFGTSGTGQLSTAAAVLVVVFVTGFVMAFAWSWGPMGWLVPTEICPLELRSAGQAMNAGVNMFFTFVIGQFFLSLLCNLKFGLFFLFAAFVVVMTGFIYFFLPETRNVPIEDMGEVFRRHWFWQKYAAVDDDDNNKGGSAPRRSVELK